MVLGSPILLLGAEFCKHNPGKTYTNFDPIGERVKIGSPVKKQPSAEITFCN